MLVKNEKRSENEKSNYFFNLNVFYKWICFWTTGYYGSFEFKIFDDKKMVDLSSDNWKVITYNTSNFFPTHGYKYPDYYKINVEGGNGRENLFVDIVFKKDTMRIYTPSIGLRTVTFDSIAFKKGVFKTPTFLYDLKDLIKSAPINSLI